MQKTEEVDEEGNTHEIGSVSLEREAELPDDQREQMPPTSIQPLSREMAIEIDQPSSVAPSLNEVFFSNLKIRRKDPRVLIVEDNSVNLRLLKIFIRKCGYRDIETAVNGALAVEASEKSGNGFDIIFMDLSMPVMDGFEATRRIWEMEEQHQVSTSESKRAHIVALTGLASKQYEQLAFNAGVDLYITKPVQFKRLEIIFIQWESHGEDPKETHS
jgi:CheY-like chemotaxis protein